MAIKLNEPCKRVELLKMVLVNFKGFKGRAEILFYEGENEIIGDNGLGKSSILDAFIWTFTGRTKEGDSKGIEVINDDCDNARVEVHFADEDGDIHSLVREQKRTKNGLVANIKLDFENILQKDLSQIIDDEKLLSISNPLYFQNLDKDKAREVLLSIMPEITKEDVFNKMQEKDKNLIQQDAFNINNTNEYLTHQRRKIRELEKEKEFKKGYLKKLKEEIKIPEKMDYNKEKERKLEEKLNNLSKEKPEIKDIKELLLKRNKLEEKIRTLSNSNSKKEVKQKILNKIALLEKDLETLAGTKLEKPDIGNAEKELILLRGAYIQSQKDIERVKEEIKKLENKKNKHKVGDVCFTCKQILTEDAVKKLHKEVQIDIDKMTKELEKAEKEFNEVSKKGIALAKKVKENEAKYKKELEKFEKEKTEKSNKINKEIEKLKIELKEINEDKNSKEIEKEINLIKKQIEGLGIEKIEKENEKILKEFEEKITKEREIINKELKAIRNLKEKAIKNNARREELLKLKEENSKKAKEEEKEIKEIDEKIKILNRKIDQMRIFNSEMMKITNEILSKHLDKVKISLQKVLKTTGEIRDDFEVFYEGRALKKCSLSETIKAGIELSYMISQLTKLEFPIIIDNSESITNIDSSKAFQMVKLRVVKGKPLSYRQENGKFEAIPIVDIATKNEAKVEKNEVEIEIRQLPTT